MARRFFRSIPNAVRVRDPYEEVFLLFTGEKATSASESGEGGGLWQHNRSVSQTSNLLEVELAFTPVPTPPRTPTMERSLSSNYTINNTTSTANASSSRPNSRPGSRAGLRGVAVNNSMAEESSGISQEAISNQQQQQQPLSPAPTSSSKNPLFRPGGSKRSKSSSSSTASSPNPSSSSQPQSFFQKPFVIHQSLSTLSQPGQTGSVVWDSSILMAKFLLSVRELQLSHFLLSDNLHMASDKNDMESDIVDEDEDDESDDGEDESEEEEDDGWQTRLVFEPRRTTILELGSGCGLLGVVLVEFCRRLLLTDQSAVLPLLLKNLKKNLDKRYFAQEATTTNTHHQNKREKTSHDGNSLSSASQNRPLCQLQIQELLWGQDQLDPDLRRGVGFDFVMATDVIYNEAITSPLVKTLADLCAVRERARQEGRMDADDDLDRDDGMARQDDGITRDGGQYLPPRKLAKTVVLLAQELRTDYVHMSFLEKMKAAGFKMYRMPKSLMDPEFHNGYVIYACWLK